MWWMSWGLFGKIAILICINAFVKTLARCAHDNFCFICKKDPCCK
ncbi:MAG: hypothetical protein WC419_05175 [Candidatus Omnitrophota bacterium]|nr:hypothetical protein [Candidatus Omnitrophota bacterium]